MKNPENKNKIMISKPEASCQGKGIFLFKNIKHVNSE